MGIWVWPRKLAHPPAADSVPTHFRTGLTRFAICICTVVCLRQVRIRGSTGCDRGGAWTRRAGLLTFVDAGCCFGETASWGVGGELVEMDGTMMTQLFTPTLNSAAEWRISDMQIT